MSVINYSGQIIGEAKLSYNLNASRTSTYNVSLKSTDESFEETDCPIVAVEYEGFSPNKIINMISREDEIYQNTMDFMEIESLENDNGLYEMSHYTYCDDYNSKLQYLVTSYESQNGKKLFYQYEPLFNVHGDGEKIAIKNIYLNNNTRLSQKDYIIQYSYDLLDNTTNRYSDTTWGQIDPGEKAHRIRILLPYETYNRENFYTIEYEKSLNGTLSYQKEVIELEKLHNTTDYTITPSGLILTDSSSIPSGSNLYIIKDPYSKVSPLDIITLKDENSYVDEKSAQWKLRINAGSFLIESGVYTGSKERLYSPEDVYSSNDIAITNVKPYMVTPNIMYVKEAPIYINSEKYTYPSYDVETYNKNIYSVYDLKGKLSISTNGQTREDIRITSIDTKKGYIELDQSLDNTDDIEISFFGRSGEYTIVENLELNPKVDDGGAMYHISDYPNGIGIALKPFNDSQYTEYPYLYDLSQSENNRYCYLIQDPSDDTPVIPAKWDDDFFTICELHLNKLSKDTINVTDARRKASINYDKLDEWMDENNINKREKDWYIDRGNYDGDIFSSNSTIVIHIPKDKLTSMRDNWINYYKKYHPYSQSKIIGDREYRYYLDKIIKKHISAGSDYILLPTVSGEIQSIENLNP